MCQWGELTMVFKGLSIAGIITGLILITIAFTIASDLLPDVQTSAIAINDTGLPLATLFDDGGVVLLMVMAGLILGVIGVLGFKANR